MGVKLTDKKLEIEKPPQNAVAIFRQTSKGMGELRFYPHAKRMKLSLKRG